MNATYEVGNGCTGFFISPKGHFLTALHCIEGLLDPSRPDEDYRQVRRWEFLFRNSEVFAPAQERSNEHVTFEFYVLGHVRDVEVLLIGKRVGASYLDDKYAQDFALLKIDPRPNDQFDVLKLRYQKPQGNEKLWAYGFPSAIEERNGESVQPGEGFDLLISSGHVRYSPAQTLGATIDLIFGSQWQGFLSETMEVRNTYTANIDIAPGMSGGPIVDRDGKAVGVLTRGFKRYGADEKVNVSFIHTHLISELIQRSLPLKEQKLLLGP